MMKTTYKHTRTAVHTSLLPTLCALLLIPAPASAINKAQLSQHSYSAVQDVNADALATTVGMTAVAQ